MCAVCRKTLVHVKVTWIAGILIQCTDNAKYLAIAVVKAIRTTLIRWNSARHFAQDTIVRLYTIFETDTKIINNLSQGSLLLIQHRYEKIMQALRQEFSPITSKTTPLLVINMVNKVSELGSIWTKCTWKNRWTYLLLTCNIWNLSFTWAPITVSMNFNTLEVWI